MYAKRGTGIGPTISQEEAMLRLLQFRFQPGYLNQELNVYDVWEGDMQGVGVGVVIKGGGGGDQRGGGGDLRGGGGDQRGRPHSRCHSSAGILCSTRAPARMHSRTVMKHASCLPRFLGNSQGMHHSCIS